MNRSYKIDHSEQTIIIIAVAVALLFLSAGHFYHTHKGKIHGLLIKYISAQMTLVEPFSRQIAAIKKNMNAENPEHISLPEMWALTGFVGKRLRWIILPFILALAGLVYFKLGKVERLNRKMTMETLLKNNVAVFPELAPIVNRKKPVTEEPLDTGPWRTARTPLQFALENRLIVDKDQNRITNEQMLDEDGLPDDKAVTLKLDKALALDLARTEYTFASQLGDVFTGTKSLKSHQKGLAAAFLAYAHGNRDTCNDLLDRFSVSFREPKPCQYSKKYLRSHQKLIAAAILVYSCANQETAMDMLNQARFYLTEPVSNPAMARRMSLRSVIMAACLIYALDREAGNTMLIILLPLLNAQPPKKPEEEAVIDISGVDGMLEIYPIDHQRLNQHASYINCWLSALLEYARGKGVIACSKFIWLRPVDRSLWYALNQCGRRTAWPEAAGVRAHMQIEQQHGAAIKTPQVESAVQALEEDLIHGGYIFMPDIMEDEDQGCDDEQLA